MRVQAEPFTKHDPDQLIDVDLLLKVPVGVGETLNITLKDGDGAGFIIKVVEIADGKVILDVIQRDRIRSLCHAV